MWWIWILAAAAILITLFIFKRMPIEIIYASSATHKKRAFKVKIYNINVIRDKKRVKDTPEKEKTEKKDEEFGFSAFMESIERVKKIYKAASEGIAKMLKYLGKKTSCRNFTVHLDFGFENAAHTGIAAGAAYGIVYGVASIVYNNLNIKKEDMDIEVNPRFNKVCTDLYVKSIFRLSPAHIIKVLIMLFKINKDIKKIIKQ